MPALGSVAACINQADMLAQRFFKAFQGITFKTITDATSDPSSPGDVLLPLAFIKVDTEMYRLMSMNRTYSAEQNSFETTISGMWVGDQP